MYILYINILSSLSASHCVPCVFVIMSLISTENRQQRMFERNYIIYGSSNFTINPAKSFDKHINEKHLRPEVTILVYPIGTSIMYLLHVINEFKTLCEILLPNMIAYIISYNILLHYLGIQKPTMILQLYVCILYIYFFYYCF